MKIKSILSKRKQTEEVLQQSEGHYQQLFNLLPYGGEVISKEGKIINCSQSTSQMLGYGMDELIGRHITNFFDADTVKIFKQNFPKILKGESLKMEVCMKHKNGTSIDILRAVEPILNADGEVEAVLALNVDITERKQAEKALRIVESKLSNAMMIAKLGYWEYDVDDDLFTFDDHFYDIFRTTAEKVGGYKMSSEQYAKQFVHPDDRLIVGNETRQAIETTDPNYSRQLEHRIIYADGEIGNISISIFIIKDDHGRTVKTYGANQDITKRKQAEEIIIQEHDQMQQYLDIAGVMFIVLDKKGMVTLINKKGCEILGYDETEVLNKNWFDLCIHEDIRENIKGVFNQLMAGEITPVEYYENAVITKTGEERIIAFHNTVIRDKESHIKNLLSSGDDITERKQAEEKILRSKILLESSIESPKDMVIVSLDREYRYLYFNKLHADSMVPAYGKRPRLGDCIFDYITRKDDIKNVKAHYDKAMSGDGHTDIQEYGDGEARFYYEVRYNPIYNEKNEIIGVTSFAMNITKRKQSEKLQSVIYEISKATQSTKTLDELYESVHKILGEVLNVTNFYIAIYDEKEQMLTFPFFKDEKEESPESAQPFGNGITEYVIKYGKPLLLNKKDEEEYTRKDKFKSTGPMSELWMGAPLIIDNRVIGVIAVNSYHDPNLYNEEDLKVLTYVSEQVAQAIEQTRSMTERKRVENELEKYREHLEEMVEERTSELEEKNKKLEWFNKLFVDREFRIKELRDKVKVFEAN